MYAAHHFGVSFLGRHSEGLAVSVLGRKTLIRVLCSIEFTSRRKISSMLIHVGFQDDSSSSPAAAATSSSSSNSSSSSSNGGSTRGGPSGLKGKIILLTKGADTVILPLLKQVGFRV